MSIVFNLFGIIHSDGTIFRLLCDHTNDSAYKNQLLSHYAVKHFAMANVVVDLRNKVIIKHRTLDVPYDTVVLDKVFLRAFDCTKVFSPVNSTELEEVKLFPFLDGLLRKVS